MNNKCYTKNCPEFLGKNCWFDEPISEISKLMIMREIKDFLKDSDYELSQDFEKLFNKNKSRILYYEEAME